ncbi:hypothetical protein HPP92_016019 [Vanilla planifolia]|uniref:Uncharacterized protein n=1 Tax=Vanilla planifolia TaxID=51239 RepID=A0A835URP4_VANPL|nr:hypothetical protein HPP92_016019 [Vanilla planifolia]
MDLDTNRHGCLGCWCSPTPRTASRYLLGETPSRCSILASTNLATRKAELTPEEEEHTNQRRSKP